MKNINWWYVAPRYISITLAALLGAVNVIVFMLPFNITPTGVTGISIILNHFVGTPISLMILLLNIPIQIIGYKMLPGSWLMVANTVFVVFLNGLSIDLLKPFFPEDGVSSNILLNAIFAGVVGGIASGILFRAGASWGGTSTLALILQRQLGLPMSSTFLYVDMLVVGMAGLTFGWEPALYATVTLFIGGVATDYVLEGPSVVRTALIVTDHPEEVAEAVLYQMKRGATGWEVTGMYKRQQRWMLYVSISRSEMHDLSRIVMEADPAAFTVIVQGHVAYGTGFKQYKFQDGTRKVIEHEPIE